MHHTESVRLNAPDPNQIKVGSLAIRNEWQDKMAAFNGISGEPGANIIDSRGINNLVLPRDYSDAVMSAIENEDPTVYGHLTEYVLRNYIVDYKEKAHAINLDPVIAEYVTERNKKISPDLLLEAWPEFIERYSNGLQKGIEQGYLPAVAAERFKESVHKTQVRLVDGEWANAFGGFEAYYTSNAHEVGLSTYYNIDKESIILNLAHEFGHNDSGSTFIRTDHIADETDEHIRTGMPSLTTTGIARLRLGFTTDRREDEPIKQSMNEAVNHHTTLSILYGDFETMNPLEREDKDGTYVAERMLYAASIDKSKGIVTVQHLTNALYEDTVPKGGFTDRKAMIRAYKDAYGWGALRKLDMLSKIMSYIPLEKIDDLITSRIHPPVVDADRRVITKGSIDIDNLPGIYEIFNNYSNGASIFRTDS